MSLHYYPIVNKMVKLMKLRRKSVFFHSQIPDEFFARPFITVSREPGSGGAPIAQMLAKKLGFEFVDKQIIEEIAKSTKKRRQIIKTVDEKARSAIEDMVHSLANPQYVSDYKYISELIKVVLAYACQGKTVILGRGANFITPFSKGLHVRFAAPYSYRLKNAIKYEGHTSQKAKDEIAKTDKDRKSFVKKYFKKDISKGNYYDLIINTSMFELEESRDIVLEAFYKKFSRLDRYRAII